MLVTGTITQRPSDLGHGKSGPQENEADGVEGGTLDSTPMCCCGVLVSNSTHWSLSIQGRSMLFTTRVWASLSGGTRSSSCRPLSFLDDSACGWNCTARLTAFLSSVTRTVFVLADEFMHTTANGTPMALLTEHSRLSDG